MAVKNYGIHDKWTNLDKLNIVEIKSVDGVIESVKINGEDAGGGGSSWQTVFEGSVTTEQAPIGDPRGIIEGLSSLTADTIKVTFNGTEYTCEKQEDEGDIFYGNTDGSYSEYPFYISNGGDGVYLTTQTAGTYTLKIEEPQKGEI